MYLAERICHNYEVDEFFVHNILCTYEACFMREGAFSFHNSHPRARHNHHITRDSVTKSDLASIIRLVSFGNNALGPYILHDRLTAQQYSNFLESVLPRFLEDAPLPARQILRFQHDRAPANDALDGRQLSNATKPGILVYKIPTRCNFFCLFGFFNSTCFGRSLRPSSGVIYKL